MDLCNVLHFTLTETPISEYVSIFVLNLTLKPLLLCS